jgi:hypothetical protein
MAQCKVLWRNVTLFGAKSASLAQRKVALRQRTLHCSNVGLHCAMGDYFAPKKVALAQSWLIWRKARFFGATSPSMAQSWPTA